jgi:MYND finger
VTSSNHIIFKITKKTVQIGNICEECFITSSELKRCTGCRLVYYCSKNCQINDWENGHMIECTSETFKNNFIKKETVDVRCQIFRAMSFLLMNSTMAQKKVDLYNGHTRCFNDLMSNQEFHENGNSPLKKIYVSKWHLR